jgi:Domain of unknown function (DUF333)
MRSIVIIVIAALTVCPEKAWTLANPAAVFCVKSGGKSEIRKGARGEHGVCRLSLLLVPIIAAELRRLYDKNLSRLKQILESQG